MKKFIKLLIIVLIFFTLMPFSLKNIDAKGDLDYIHDYQITVEPLKDGRLKMTYHLVWEVLDSSSDGPLTWVEIGVMNNRASDLVNLSKDVIKSISFNNEFNNSKVEIHFYKKYLKGDIVDFSFSLIQDYAFTISDDGNIEYRFRPGYFNEIIVENCTVKWKIDNILYTNTDTKDGDYYMWKSRLDYGETFNVDAKYNKFSFPEIDLEKTYTANQRRETKTFIIIVISVVFVIILMAVLFNYYARITSDGYYYYSGFSGRHFMYYSHRPRHSSGYSKKGNKIINPTVTGSSSSSSSGSSCACACACACAGGGRAGCSRKDVTNEKQLKDN